MDKYTTYVGMDVHARSVTAKALNIRTGEMFSKRFETGYCAAEISDWIDSTLARPVLCAYESGVTGIWLARDLITLGIDCEVIAISTLPTSQKDRKQKCDKHDAQVILREMTNPSKDYSAIYIPDERTEAERDLCRAREKAAIRLRQARQELSSFLLRHGHTWNERTGSGCLKKSRGRAYEKWLDAISFAEPACEMTFSFLRRHAKTAEEELHSIEASLSEVAQSDENKPYVDALSLIKGISRTSAMLIKAEVGRFSRFSSGRKVSSWIGCVPKNHSSGEREVSGRITKAGNKYIRRCLVEGAASLPNWLTAVKPRCAPELPAAVVSKADDANKRLHERYRYLKDERGKHINKARMAVVSEMMRWIWVIGLMVEREQEKKTDQAACQ